MVFQKSKGKNKKAKGKTIYLESQGENLFLGNKLGKRGKEVFGGDWFGDEAHLGIGFYYEFILELRIG